MRQPNSRLWLVVPIIFVAWIGQTWAGPRAGEGQAETLRWQLLGPPGGEEVFDVDVDPNDPMRDQPVAVVGEQHRKKLKYTCAACKPDRDRPPLPCVQACKPLAISHSW